ncbi:MAG: T9SS type A sorting domain-containing protein, partial [Paludibacteraceae bacterium]|nr:T9SS type A sorting domain-containing protein [Paludibacteraceae bacterium]
NRKTYTIQRSTGKFSNFTTIGTSTGTSYTDNVGGNLYQYYYRVLENDNVLFTLSLETELFGENVYFYHPSDDQAKISAEINAIHDAMFHDQFSENRYSFYFHPGKYLNTGDIKIAYYMSIAGLGKLPYDTELFYLATPAPLDANNATCTFWRSAENFQVTATDGGDAVMAWGVSQAAPFRRIVMERPCQFDYWAGWASGGFASDCYFMRDAGSWSQQQFYLRNCYMQNGIGRYQGGWNWAMQGIEFGPGTDMGRNSDNWSPNEIERGWGNVSREATTPVIREKPFLFFDTQTNRFKVFRPALREANSTGISYTKTNMGQGTVYDILNDFYVAKPGVTAATLNAQLRAGKHLFFTPGQYVLEAPLVVNNPNTILLGTGYATLIPGETCSSSAVIVGDVDGVTIASFMFDTFYSSENLLRVGPNKSNVRHTANPTLLADCFFRIGGFKPWDVNVSVALKINSNDVIGDHFWIWRADHGDGVGWDRNTCNNGIVVEGSDVVVYGLHNEHFQQYQALWKGENGKCYFLQCETPYDVLDQGDYQSHTQTRNGFSAYKVGPDVQNHYASMLGIYDVFIYTQGARIMIKNSIEVPKRPGVWVHHACNVNISGTMGGFDRIINDTIASTYYTTNQGQRRHIVDYRYTHYEVDEPLPDDEDGSEGSETPEWEQLTDVEAVSVETASIDLYPNPTTAFVYVNVASGEVADVLVYTLSGTLLQATTSEKPVFLGNYDKGTYIVKVVTSAGSDSFKVIKM